MNKPLVNIAMITYNHGNFIAQAIEGVLMQKTTFDFQLVIGEDCSTDNTYEICLKYKNEYPEKIVLLHNEINIGVYNNLIKTFNACEAKYLGTCEGDDYWTDPYKLQKQVDFLEKNNDFSMTFHRSSILYENENKIIEANNNFNENKEFDGVEAYKKMSFQSGSMVYRKNLFVPPKNFEKYIFPDNGIILSLAMHGKFYGFSDIMSVYRKHDGGLSNPSWEKAMKFLEMMDLIDSDFGEKVHNATKYRRYNRFTYLGSIYAKKKSHILFYKCLYNATKYNPKFFFKKDMYKLLKDYFYTLLFK